VLSKDSEQVNEDSRNFGEVFKTMTLTEEF
jgi:hypothetical protein